MELHTALHKVYFKSSFIPLKELKIGGICSENVAKLHILLHKQLFGDVHFSTLPLSQSRFGKNTFGPVSKTIFLLQKIVSIIFMLRYNYYCREKNVLRSK